MNESTSWEESPESPDTPNEDRSRSAATCDSEPVFRKKNARRIALIKKKNREGLSPAEAEESAILDQEVAAYLNQKFPLPPVDMSLLDEIEARLRSAVPPASS
jgi:hypothetical protein